MSYLKNKKIVAIGVVFALLLTFTVAKPADAFFGGFFGGIGEAIGGIADGIAGAFGFKNAKDMFDGGGANASGRAHDNDGLPGYATRSAANRAAFAATQPGGPFAGRSYSVFSDDDGGFTPVFGGEILGGEGGAGGGCSANYTQPCTTGMNYCGDSNSGTYLCNGVCSVSAAPEDAQCQYELPEDPIIFTPALVRRGDTINVAWDVGQNYPPNCTITGKDIGGAGDNERTLSENEATGNVDVVVTDPHTYKIECTGGYNASATVRIVSSLQET